MDIEVDVSSPEPAYEQIVRQIVHAVLTGALAAGAALPSIRQLADDLELNHNTVARAYKLLEGEHVIVTAGRKGTFVGHDAARRIAARTTRDAQFEMERMVLDLAARGLSAGEIRAAFALALQALEEKPA
ncbi:MAG TPA: GntR family transcriptional regulator [Burkholderiaceae bacterium]